MLQKLKNTYARLWGRARTTITDDEHRQSLINICCNGCFCLVAAAMTVVNIFTAKWLLMCSTLLFSVLCVVNILLCRGGRLQLSLRLFLIEAIVLCSFFCVSGTPDGFSVLWTCFIPTYSLTVLGRKQGTLYSALAFLMLVFFLWTPWGRGLLLYEYTPSFLLRFPMIYIAFYMVGLFLESIRDETQRQLRQAEQKYQYLYKHDALTGLYNRYGFNEKLNEIFSDPACGKLSLFILDLDLFKNVNDTYGHDVGDVVLTWTADTLRRIAGEDSVVCRWGGEEFTVLVWDRPDPLSLGHRICREFANADIPVPGGETVRITTSVGLCTVGSREGKTIAQLVKNADQCLYQVKMAGRNNIIETYI